MNFQRGRAREEPEINLVPLIDVMMVIMRKIRITTTYSRYTELQINLPTADATRQTERTNEVSVVVNARGEYSVNKVPVAYAGAEPFAAELRRAASNLKEPIIVITADAKATHQSVVRVMEAARLAGLSQIAFTAERPAN